MSYSGPVREVTNPSFHDFYAHGKLSISGVTLQRRPVPAAVPVQTLVIVGSTAVEQALDKSKVRCRQSPFRNI
jgi:hypothetical protein